MWNEFFSALLGPSEYLKKLNMMKNDSYDFYLAGSMRGIPELNKPMFTLVARLLREKGFSIWSPAENGSYLESSFAECMTRDLDAVVNKCDGIALLPGWRDSLGTNGEAFAAYLCGKKVVEVFVNEKIESIALAYIDLSGYRLPYQEMVTCQFNPHQE